MDNLGICANCNSVGNCSFRSSNSKPVWYCNDYQPVAIVKSAGNRNSANVILQPDKVYSIEEFAGLCAYCELRVNCLMPRRSGGVWHCNEYI